MQPVGVEVHQDGDTGLQGYPYDNSAQHIADGTTSGGLGQKHGEKECHAIPQRTASLRDC